jgi:6-pyruvoyltetrahydropterin/6-carboxytetrahydropterin synthase
LTWEPKAAAYSAATTGVIDRPTIPRAPEIDSIKGASWAELDMGDSIRANAATPTAMNDSHAATGGTSLELRNIPLCLEAGRLTPIQSRPMFELTVERTFCAAHSIAVGGQREPVHGHNWLVKVAVAGPTLDRDGLLCDFHLLERELERILQPWQNQNLNVIDPFDEMNPTAEHIARHVAAALAPALPAGASLRCVSVTEAPGCVATYRLDEL